MYIYIYMYTLYIYILIMYIIYICIHYTYIYIHRYVRSSELHWAEEKNVCPISIHTYIHINGTMKPQMSRGVQGDPEA
jgi:hypothetical protein